MIKNIFLTLVLGLFANGLLAQNSITIKVVSKENKEAVIGASVYIKNALENREAFVHRGPPPCRYQE